MDDQLGFEFFGPGDARKMQCFVYSKKQQAIRPNTFHAFRQNNPHVENMIENLTLELVRRGCKCGSMRMIFERLRWEYYFNTQGEHFKLNNNYQKAYTRLMIERHPELECFFEQRSRKEK